MLLVRDADRQMYFGADAPKARTYAVGTPDDSHVLARAVVTDHDIARRIFDAIPSAARAPPSPDSIVAYEAAFA